MTTVSIDEEVGQPGRLERRKQRTRVSILNAAGHLFKQNGYDETSIADVAELADTGVGTVYGYFENKEDLLREVIRAHSQDAIDRYTAAVSTTTPPMERLLTAVDTFARYIRDHRTILRAALQVAARDRRVDEQPISWLFDAYVKMIEHGIREGELREVPVDTTVRVLMSNYTFAMLGVGVWRGKEDDERTLEDLHRLTRIMLAP